jgi:enoyl-CoA hydratase
MELLMSARQVKAEEALALGLANHVYPQTQLMSRALELARLIASKGPVAVAQVKLAVQRGQDLDLDNACALEAELFALTFSTDDQREGMSAFLERRDARFQGR